MVRPAISPKLLRWLPLLCLAFVSSDAQAIFFAAKDCCSPIKDEVFSKLQSALPFAVLSPQSRVAITQLRGPQPLIVEGPNITLGKAKYEAILIRFEDRCSYGGSCLTAIFLDDVAREKFWGLVSLPARLTRGDAPSDCTNVQFCPVTYLFEFEDKRYKALELTEVGPVMH